MAELYIEGDGPVKRLAQDLDELYPHYDPKPDDDIALIMYRAGQRSVVNHIQSLID